MRLSKQLKINNMLAEVIVKKEVDIRYVRVEAAVRYADEDIPYDFPMRKGDMWIAEIDIDQGKVIGWPSGKSGELHMKVCDEGTYTLLDADRNEVGKIEDDYVPNRLLPGSYGDYLELNINQEGKITNWYKSPSFDDFFHGEN